MNAPMIKPNGFRKENPAHLVAGKEDADYKTPLPINQLFKVLLQATVQSCSKLKRMRIEVDMGLTEKEGSAKRDIGIFTGKFRVQGNVNWVVTINWTHKRHQDLPSYHAYVKYGDADIALVPSLVHPRSPTIWFSRFMQPDDLKRDCIEYIARRTGKPYIWDLMGGPEVDARLMPAEIREYAGEPVIAR